MQLTENAFKDKHDQFDQKQLHFLNEKRQNLRIPDQIRTPEIQIY